MRKHFILYILLALSVPSFAQTWTQEQLDAANTAKGIPYLDTVEREAIMYLNLARLYPGDFLNYEVRSYVGTKKYGDFLKGAPEKVSLIATLEAMQPVGALAYDSALYANAKCFAKELGEVGRTGHTRNICPKENYAECLTYGMETGKDVVMSWLIDHKVASLGHRKICLNPVYVKIGLSKHPHTRWDSCAVAEFSRR